MQRFKDLKKAKVIFVMAGCTPEIKVVKTLAKDLTGCFNHCCVEGGDHSIHVSIFTVHDAHAL